METDVNAIPEIIDLCTPTLDIDEVVEASVVVKENESMVSSTFMPFERISNIDQRLSILPLYPTNDMQDQGKYPWLANFPRMYKWRNLS
jgi:hypothetical protein